MSRCIEISSLTSTERKKLSKELEVEREPSKYAFAQNVSYLYPYDIEKNILYVPFAYSSPPIVFQRKPRNCNIKYSFTGKLREEQDILQKEAIEKLNHSGSVIVAAYTGFGKTVTANFIIQKVGMKTLIIAHRVLLINQWVKAVKDFLGVEAQIIDSDTVEITKDICIVNPIMIPKFPRSFFKDIGFVIVDECHLIMAEGLSKSMLYITPRYVLGLSATPYRTDGLNILLDLYFGKDKIVRKLDHAHIVYTINTNISPKIETGKNGKVNWGVVLDSLCNNEIRNKLITRIVKAFPNRIFLILTKRISQGEELYTLLKESKESVGRMFGRWKENSIENRILIGTTSKCGTGFDDARLDALILASDVEQYFIQFLGRIFRRKDVKPIIFDLIDNNSILKKHFASRKEVYEEHGGLIKDFNTSFPKIKLIQSSS